MRIRPQADPNPFFQMAAAEDEFDPVHPLPPKPKRERKKKPKPQLPDEWPIADISALTSAWQKRYASQGDATPSDASQERVPQVNLPDHWPLAPLPLHQLRPPRPLPETFEVLAYRFVPDELPDSHVPPLPPPVPHPTIIFSPPEPTPPAPKHLSPRSERRRFAWESPEMYLDE